MVRIRLAREGSKKRPFYYLTVADKRKARNGRFIERVGFYNPLAKDQADKLSVNLARVDYWLGVGGQPTERVEKLILTARRQASTPTADAQVSATSEIQEADAGQAKS